MGKRAGGIFDFAVVGSSINAGLVAGLLARDHKKSVCLIVDPSTRMRLAREINLSVDCITRPETWKLLSGLQTETQKLLTRIGGRRSLKRVHPLLICNSENGAEALAHMMHVARGSGFEVERPGAVGLPNAKGALRVRGARMLERHRFAPALYQWLATNDVEILSQLELEFSFKRDGSVLINSPGGEVGAHQLVLADEPAISNHAKPSLTDRHFQNLRATALLSEPVHGPTERLVINPENRFSANLLPNGSFEILAHCSTGQVAKHVLLNLADGNRMRRAGKAGFNTVMTADGAPLLGNLGHKGTIAIAGFGNFAAFVAPAIARYLAGSASEFEQSYFSVRGGDAKRQSQLVSEFTHSLGERA